VQHVADLATSVTIAPRNAQRRSVLVGLIGKGIQMSRTPAMHEAEGLAQGLNYVYRLLDTESIGGAARDLAEMVGIAESFGFVGLNVTHPYKQDIIAHLDKLSEDAAAVESVNTVIFEDGRRIGHNTDLSGFEKAFRRVMAGAARKRVVLLGAGGAGTAVALGLLRSGVGTLLVNDIDRTRAEALVARFVPHYGSDRVFVAADVAGAVTEADGVVNATPAGMAKLPGMPIPTNLLSPTLWVADIVYFPLETELLKAARQVGCRTMSGEDMAVFQAAHAFELFSGLAPDNDRMRAAFAACGTLPAGQAAAGTASA
jgi:shikimate dehydrogenase